MLNVNQLITCDLLDELNRIRHEADATVNTVASLLADSSKSADHVLHYRGNQLYLAAEKQWLATELINYVLGSNDDLDTLPHFVQDMLLDAIADNVTGNNNVLNAHGVSIRHMLMARFVRNWLKKGIVSMD